MKLGNKLIYIVGTISVLLLGVLVVGGIALFLTHRIDAASNTHAQREAERLAELPEEEKPSEFIIEDIEVGVFSGNVYWGTSDNPSEGRIVFYMDDDVISLSESRSEFPQDITYSEELMTAIEDELETSE